MTDEDTEKLRRSEGKYRAIFEGAADGILYSDMKARVLDVNPAYTEITGISKQEAVGKTGFQLSKKFFGVKDLPRIFTFIKNNISGKKVKPIELKDQDKTYEVSTRMVPERKGIVVVLRDITDRKKAEEELKRNELLLNQTQRLTKVGGWEYDVIEKTLIWTDEVYRIYGVNKKDYDPNDVKKNIEFYYPEDREKMDRAFSEALNKGKSYDLELRFITGQGELRWVRTIGKPVKKKGKVIKIQGNMMDITERKETEKAHREREQLLTNVFESMQEGIFVLNHDFKYTYWNHAMEEISHTPREKVLGTIPWEKFPFLKGKIEKAMKKAMNGESSRNIELAYNLPDGKEGWTTESYFPLKDMDGNIEGVVSVIEDITERKQIEEQIKKELREKEILIRELYHRTKNNMQVISSILCLRARTIHDQGLKKVLQEINNKIQSMALVHKKLYESKDLSTLKLKNYFSDLISLIEQSYLESRDSIKLIYRAEDVSVLIDTAIPLGLVLIELLSNSIRHGFPKGQKGEIYIRLRKKPQDKIVLEVQDNGKGLPQGFDVEKDGGLGLKTVMGLARDQLGGKVTFESQEGVRCRILIKEELHKPRV